MSLLLKDQDYSAFIAELKSQQAAGQLEFAQQLVAQVKFVQRIVAQIPWGHNLLIVSKCRDQQEALPDELKSSLPTIEEIEAELGGTE